MDLDEAITKYEKLTARSENGVAALEAQGLPFTAEKYRASAKEYKQLADWLKELKELRGESNG